ncbi:hypothetical protein RNJ44_03210 [Nakaseomyces bracarensis]|uniref:Uncharacterized protein n=1 Tax=Nakaseomyces bracarensis TaxID=273131 RepID=A0ABR4NZ44_9SACH
MVSPAMRSLIGRPFARLRTWRYLPTRFSSTASLNLNSSSAAKLESKLESKGSKTEDDDTPLDFIYKLPEQLISQGNGLTPTTASRQINTLDYYKKLKYEGGFNKNQTNAVIDMLLELINDEFYNTYNTKFLRDMELNKQSHLFNSAETELKYAIQNSRETQLNSKHIELMLLQRDLASLHDEISGMIINSINKDSKMDFNNHKLENTLMLKEVNLALSDCKNKIITNLIGQLRSDVENLRWQTTRSGLVAILLLVLMVMGTVSLTKGKTSDERPNKEEEIMPEEYIE